MATPLSARSIRPSHHLVAALLLPAFATAQAVAEHFETGPVRPIEVTADGQRLLALHAADHRLMVYDVAVPAKPQHLCDVMVGLEPVAVRARTDREVWVVNNLSDSISIVDVLRGEVVDTLRVVDEPADVVFAAGKAFVTAMASDEVQVFDAQSRAPLGAIPVFGKDPRSLAVSPSGGEVYVLAHRSGNGTTTLPEKEAPDPPNPTNPALPDSPEQGLIIRADDPQWAQHVTTSLPDHDIFEIDAVTGVVTRRYQGVGTINYDLVVHPVSGQLFVANTEARNLVRFEPALRGHIVDNRVTIVTPGSAASVTPVDLNPTIDYGVLPNPVALAESIATPTGLALDASASRLYVAGFGSDRIGVLDLAGNVLGRIDVRPPAPSTTVDMRGPRGLALHPTGGFLYALNDLSATLAVIDTASLAVTAELAFAHDPLPQVIREGRRFLHDARLSGNGTGSCASCHVDGGFDGLAWDLGDPGGDMEPGPVQPAPFAQLLEDFHPVKGPMVTQTLRGLDGHTRLHWRGERNGLASFNPTFDKLLGGSELSTPEMDTFSQYMRSILFPPNPNQNLDRSQKSLPANANAAAGELAYRGNSAACNVCHTLPLSSNNIIIGAGLPSTQQMKVPQLRNLYRKNGYRPDLPESKAGFGFTHDGIVGDLDSFLLGSPFVLVPTHLKDHLVAFLLAIDTGTAPAVGHQITLTATRAQDPAVLVEFATLRARAGVGDCDLVAKGIFGGSPRGLLYDPVLDRFVADGIDIGPFTTAELLQHATQGDAVWTLTGVLPGHGPRIGIDRDGDGNRDHEDGATPYGSDSPGCRGWVSLRANREPRDGDLQFALVGTGQEPGAVGYLATSLAPLTTTVTDFTVLVDYTDPSIFFRLLTSDARGVASVNDPALVAPSMVGVPLYCQTLFVDSCTASGWIASHGLEVTLRP